MSNSQQMFQSGEARGHAAAKTDQMTQSAKNTANTAQEKASNAAQSAKESAQQGKESTQGFLQQTGEQVMNMAQGAVDSVKSTLGVGESQTKK
ncbi:late embryogenesis abundant protein 1-like [Magnolia sinica]|uniref:late embryogenesis abundant protein 1-like n=1 Tax=Magnolia sinica TaxID=86752 RepID=UPI002657C753|nr:late embryogenesis abundant protein 1-like [Magnolia sinica]